MSKSWIVGKYDKSFLPCFLWVGANRILYSSFINFINDIWQLDRIEASFVLKILFWLTKSKSGELDELDYYGKEYSFLNEINSKHTRNEGYDKSVRGDEETNN